MIEVIISIFVLAINVVIVMNFRGMLADQEATLLRTENFYSVVDTELSSLYLTEWEDLEDKTKRGEVEIVYGDVNVNKYGNYELEVNFVYHDYEESFTIERSVYHE